MAKNDQLELFRAKVKMLMTHYADRMKMFVMEEKLTGASVADTKAIRDDPESSWNKEKEALNKNIKREASSLINRINIEVMRKGLK